jgi:hypothetical protein
MRLEDIYTFIYLFIYIQNAQNRVAQSIQRLGYGLGDRGSIPDRGNEGALFSSPSLPDRL